MSNHCDYFGVIIISTSDTTHKTRVIELRGVIIISTSDATHKTRVIELRQKYIEPKLLFSQIYVVQISIKKEAIYAPFRSPLNYFWYVLPL